MITVIETLGIEDERERKRGTERCGKAEWWSLCLKCGGHGGDGGDGGCVLR